MAICNHGHRYDGSHPDNNIGCPLCIRMGFIPGVSAPGEVSKLRNQETCVHIFTNHMCERCGFKLVQTAAGVSIPGEVSKLQCEAFSRSTAGDLLKCNLEVNHLGLHYSLINGHPCSWGTDIRVSVPGEVSKLRVIPTSITEWQEAVYQVAKEHGFHADLVKAPTFARMEIAEKLALIHSEVSECLECLRDGDIEESGITRMGITKPEGFPSELADVIIRCLDLGQMLGIDLEGAMRRKHEYNKSRPYKHGRKF